MSYLEDDMENIAFVIWMIFFPFFSTLGEVVRYKYGERSTSSDGVSGAVAMIMIAIWAYVGSLLYVGH